MLVTCLSRQKQRPLLALSLPALFTRHLASAPLPTVSSILRDIYDFDPPNPNSTSKPYVNDKPQNRSPSSPDPSSSKTIISDLPFDFQFSYTDSSPEVRPIGLRGPKYSPFGPGRVSRQWTGVYAPSVDIKVRSVDAVEEGEDLSLEEQRRMMRERVQGEPLTAAERKAIVEMCGFSFLNCE